MSPSDGSQRHGFLAHAPRCCSTLKLNDAAHPTVVVPKSSLWSLTPSSKSVPGAEAQGKCIPGSLALRLDTLCFSVSDVGAYTLLGSPHPQKAHLHSREVWLVEWEPDVCGRQARRLPLVPCKAPRWEGLYGAWWGSTSNIACIYLNAELSHLSN